MTLLYLTRPSATHPIRRGPGVTWLLLVERSPVHKGCDSNSQRGQFADGFSSDLLRGEAGMLEPVVQCRGNLGERGWMAGIGGYPDIGGAGSAWVHHARLPGQGPRPLTRSDCTAITWTAIGPHNPARPRYADLRGAAHSQQPGAGAAVERHTHTEILTEHEVMLSCTTFTQPTNEPATTPSRSKITLVEQLPAVVCVWPGEAYVSPADEEVTGMGFSQAEWLGLEDPVRSSSHPPRTTASGGGSHGRRYVHERQAAPVVPGLARTTSSSDVPCEVLSRSLSARRRPPGSCTRHP